MDMKINDIFNILSDIARPSYRPIFSSIPIDTLYALLYKIGYTTNNGWAVGTKITIKGLWALYRFKEDGTIIDYFKISDVYYSTTALG